MRAAAISAVIAFGLLSFSLLDIRAAQNVSLDPSVEFTDPQLVRALKGWSAKDINRQQLAEELEGKCSQAGRFGLAPIAYFLLKGDREGFSVCLSKVEVNSWVPEKYGHQNPGLWGASVLDDGMNKVFGQGERGKDNKHAAALNLMFLRNVFNSTPVYRRLNGRP